jgi:hypothetical protein
MTASPHPVCVSVFAAVLCATGCSLGPDSAVVRGTVTYKDKPVPRGTVTLTPASGRSVSGELQPDGTFVLRAVPGRYKVVIVATQDVGSRLPEDQVPLPPLTVPNKYTSIATTDLTANLNAGNNTVKFNLDDQSR